MADKNFGKMLRSLRERRNESQLDISRLLHVTPQMVSKLENGRAQPTVKALKALSHHFGLGIDELLQPEKAGNPRRELPVMDHFEPGLPLFSEQNVRGSFPVLPGVEGDFYFRVHGDCMEPIVPGGCLVLVLKVANFQPRQIGVVRVREGEVMVRRVFFDELGVLLQCENPLRPPLFIPREEWEARYDLVGTVTLVLHWMKNR